MFSIVLVALFLGAMILIGVWGMKKTTSLNDFFLGGRSIGPWISALAYSTSYFSAVIFIGFAGKLGWEFGLNVLWIAVGNTLFGSCLAWLVLGRRTRRMSQNLDVMTMPEFINDRFDGSYLKIFSAIIIFTFLLPYSASVFKGLGHLFEVNFGISYDLALLIMIVITGVYLVMGGYFAITMTDFIQGIIMIIGSILMITVLIGKSGGLVNTIAQIAEKYPAHIPAGRVPSPFMLFSLVFMTSFGTWGLPQMVQKYYAIRDEKVIKTAAIVTTLVGGIISFSAYFNGSMTHIFFDSVPLENGKAAFDKLIPFLLSTHLPEILMGIILLLVLSASMSSLSSLVLVSASSISIDIFKGHINPSINKKNSLALMRFLSAIFIVISYFIARYEFALIVTLMSLSWGVVAGTFMAPFLYGLYWKRTTRAGITAGMITGASLAIILFFVLGPRNSPIASTIAMLAPFIVIPAVSLFTQPPSKETIEKAFNNI